MSEAFKNSDLKDAAPETPSVEPAVSSAKVPAVSAEAPEAAPVALSSASAQPVSPAAAPGHPEESTESFAELFAAQESSETPGAHLTPGQRVKVTVVAVTNDTIFVSTGTKVDGIVDREELEDKERAAPQVGDVLDLYVVTVSPQEVRLSKMMSGAGGLAALEEAKEARLPVEGKVKALVKGGFAVEVMKRRAFCPMGQMDLRPVTEPEAFVGKTFPFVVTRLEKAGRNIVLSRRVLLEQEQTENLSAFLEHVKEGDTLEGSVTRLAAFGAFVELAPGIEGLAHLSELSWARVAQADEAVSVGQPLKVKVLGISRSEKGTRISLSVRQASEDPWNSVTANFREGEVVSGTVQRIAPFGVFVSLAPGVEGLVHISELSYEKRIQKAEDVVSVGEVVSVRIKGIDTDKKRISLSLREAGDNPWDSVSQNFVPGQEVSGVVENKAAFGVFVTLAPGITGLVPASSISGARNKAGLDKVRGGESVTVVVREIDAANRKITLGLPGSENETSARRPREDSDWKKHAPKPSPVSFGGTLGLALQAAAEKKKK